MLPPRPGHDVRAGNVLVSKRIPVDTPVPLIATASRYEEGCERGGLTEDAADVDEHGRPGVLPFQPSQPHVKALVRVLAANLASGIRALGQIIGQSVDPLDYRLKLFPNEQVPHDKKTILVKLTKLSIGKPGGSARWGPCSGPPTGGLNAAKNRAPFRSRPGPPRSPSNCLNMSNTP